VGTAGDQRHGALGMLTPDGAHQGQAIHPRQQVINQEQSKGVRGTELQSDGAVWRRLDLKPCKL
jgi:hypothetical protein